MYRRLSDGRLSDPPPHWNRNIFSQLLGDADVLADVTSAFESGRPMAHGITPIFVLYGLMFL